MTRLEATWPTTEREAIAEQERLRGAADLTSDGPDPADIRLVAGVDVTYAEDSTRLVAAAVVLDARTLDVVEESTIEGETAFPYIPGLLAFRELPSVIRALDNLTSSPDLLICDGYGIAHPRRAGLAVHLGVLTGLPCFGVAKSPFTFAYEDPGPARGDGTPLRAEDGEVVGRALRTRTAVKPVFVSVGNAISLDRACAHTLHLTPRYRIPETTRAADQLSRRLLRGEQ